MHQQGMSHGDIKPDNIFVQEISKDSYKYKVSDFNVVKNVYQHEVDGLESVVGKNPLCDPTFLVDF
jgi:serine/threonine protein kinase